MRLLTAPLVSLQSSFMWLGKEVRAKIDDSDWLLDATVFIKRLKGEKKHGRCAQ